MITARTLRRLPGIRHGFFTRRGGRSKGLYATLNCGFGSRDEREAVAANRTIVADKLRVAPDRLLTVWQSHSPVVAVARGPWDAHNPPDADAMVTGMPRLALGILTADCAPVLFADPSVQVVGAAHAGWQGALGGVLEATVDAMEKLGAHRRHMLAAVGPAISQKNYEVGPEFFDRFVTADPGSRRFFLPSDTPGRYRFDLPDYARFRLTAIGLGSVEVLRICTYEEEKRFYSFRRASHRGEPDYGRQVSTIVIGGEEE